MQLGSNSYAMTYITILQLHVYEKSFSWILTLDVFVSYDKFSLGLSLIVITAELGGWLAVREALEIKRNRSSSVFLF